MYKNLFIFMVIIYCSCNNVVQKSTNLNNTSKIINKHVSVDKIKTSSNIIEEKIIGIWTDGSPENATFDIRKDSIYYVDDFESFKYFLRGDIIEIHYSDFIYKAKVYFKKDTLVMDAKDDELAKFWKFKN